MKQGKIYNKLILGLLLTAVVCYIAVALFRFLDTPLSTVQAIEYEAGAGCRTTGWVVRDEQVLTSPYSITVLNRREGERVGVGQVVATGYQSADAQARQNEIEAVEARLSQLRYAWTYDGDPADAASLDREIVNMFTDCARYTVQRDMTSYSAVSPRLKGLLLRSASGREELASLEAQIGELEEQLARLRSTSGSGTRSVTAPASGFFSGGADGLEQVLTPARLTSLSAAGLDALAPAAIPDRACGRLVRSPDWYFVCTAPSDLTAEVEPGDTVTTGFSHGFYNTLPMTVVRVGDDEGGRRVLVLFCGDYIQEVTMLRQQTVELVFRTYTGLRVPKTALFMDEKNRPSVYVLEGGRSKAKDVSILYDNGESYVVVLDKTDTENLWPGDEIILNPRNLFDGKVVNQS